VIDARERLVEVCAQRDLLAYALRRELDALHLALVRRALGGRVHHFRLVPSVDVDRAVERLDADARRACDAEAVRLALDLTARVVADAVVNPVPDFFLDALFESVLLCLRGLARGALRLALGLRDFALAFAVGLGALARGLFLFPLGLCLRLCFLALGLRFRFRLLALGLLPL